jgi:hypothetical protein
MAFLGRWKTPKQAQEERPEREEVEFGHETLPRDLTEFQFLVQLL